MQGIESAAAKSFICSLLRGFGGLTGFFVEIRYADCRGLLRLGAIVEASEGWLLFRRG
jgi:hypothetical protein